MKYSSWGTLIKIFQLTEGILVKALQSRHPSWGSLIKALQSKHFNLGISVKVFPLRHFSQSILQVILIKTAYTNPKVKNNKQSAYAGHKNSTYLQKPKKQRTSWLIRSFFLLQSKVQRLKPLSQLIKSFFLLKIKAWRLKTLSCLSKSLFFL